MALNVEDTTASSEICATKFPDLGNPNENTFEAAAAVIHPGQYNSVLLYGNHPFLKEYLLTKSPDGKGLKWMRGNLYVTSPDPNASCIVTIKVDFLASADRKLLEERLM